MRKLLVATTVVVSIVVLQGAALPVPRDGRGHPITEYTGVFQASNSPSTFLSVIYYDGRLYAAQRGAGGRLCFTASRAPGGMNFNNGWPEYYDHPPLDIYSISSINSQVFASELNGLRESKSFWPRVAESANVWDMYAYDAHRQPKYCVPESLVTSGPHNVPPVTEPAVVPRPVVRPTPQP